MRTAPAVVSRPGKPGNGAHDPAEALIGAANLHRRNLTAGQRAMKLIFGIDNIYDTFYKRRCNVIDRIGSGI